MKPKLDCEKFLKVRYDKEFDILNVLVPGRKIEVSSQVTAPLVIDFGSEEDGFDVVGFELHAASQYLAPLLEAMESVTESVGGSD